MSDLEQRINDVMNLLLDKLPAVHKYVCDHTEFNHYLEHNEFGLAFEEIMFVVVNNSDNTQVVTLMTNVVQEFDLTKNSYMNDDYSKLIKISDSLKNEEN
jgi:hypothetical protein